jgi:protocatechuate 3,4-dioxygenase beta subunit
MKAIILSAFIFLTQQSPSTPPAQQTERSRIEGVVVKAGTNEPLANAQVTLNRSMSSLDAMMPLSAPTAPPPAIPSAASDDQGRFVFADIAPGAYRISAARNGYARQEYGQHMFGAQGTVVHVAAGQAIKDIVFALTPAGNVTGHISDTKGEPIAGVQVQLLRAAYNPNGQRTFQSAGSARTDDRGEYRLYWITPGRYLLSATTPNGMRGMFMGAGGSPNEAAVKSYPLTYYPGTIELSRATIIEVRAGAELGAIDMTMSSQQLYHVRGRVIDPTSGQPPRNAGVVILPKQPVAPNMMMGPSRPNYDAATGTFDLRDVAPGSYYVRASVSDPNAPLPQSMAGRPMNEVLAAAFSSALSAQTEVEVTGSDVDGVTLALSGGASIPGRLTLEGQDLSSLPSFDRMRVMLRPTTVGGFGNRQPLQTIGADGSFEIDNVVAGEYRVTVMPLPPNVYVKEARLQGADVLNQTLLVTGPVSGSLEVVLSPKAAQVTGTILDVRSQPVPGVQAVLIPDRSQRTDLYKTAVADQNGHFTMKGVPPGDYKVFAWEAIEPFAYFDSDLMRQFEGKGKPVHVTESSTETAEVTEIPAGNS